MLKIFPGLLCILLPLFSIGQRKTNTPVSLIPAVPLYDIHGDTTNLSALSKGKLTFIDCWFIPCGPCFAEMNMLHALYNTYRSNNKVAFLTITFSDSTSVRPLMENRNTSNNEVYDYFKTLSNLDKFELPVYFTRNCSFGLTSFVKNKKGPGFTGSGWPQRHKAGCPDAIFGFEGYPTILIFDQSGKLIYHKTGFSKQQETQQMNTIRAIIQSTIK